jgi:chromosome segregation ATPase
MSRIILKTSAIAFIFGGLYHAHCSPATAVGNRASAIVTRVGGAASSSLSAAKKMVSAGTSAVKAGSASADNSVGNFVSRIKNGMSGFKKFAAETKEITNSATNALRDATATAKETFVAAKEQLGAARGQLGAIKSGFTQTKEEVAGISGEAATVARQQVSGGSLEDRTREKMEGQVAKVAAIEDARKSRIEEVRKMTIQLEQAKEELAKTRSDLNKLLSAKSGLDRMQRKQQKSRIDKGNRGASVLRRS